MRRETIFHVLSEGPRAFVNPYLALTLGHQGGALVAFLLLVYVRYHIRNYLLL